MGLLDNVVKNVKNNIKGKIGEVKVNMKLNPLLFGKVEHKQINNLVLIDDMGKSHQIDHVEIRENGIFCIETKNYIGWIFGSEKQDYWTQTLYTGEKNKFLSPLKQNRSHIYHISQALEGKYRINSVVVMAQNNADKIECNNVVNLSDLKSYLANFYNGVRLTFDEMEEIYNKLMEANNKMSNRAHVKNINQTQQELNNGICPRCGATLVERKGKYGSFMGCSNYPTCKFIYNDNKK